MWHDTMPFDEAEACFMGRVVEFKVHGRLYTGKVRLVKACGVNDEYVIVFILGGGAYFPNQITRILAA